MRPQEIIEKKRDGQKLSSAEIKSFIDGVTDGSWADYQTTALLMAIFIRGLDANEQNFLTDAMLHSGDVLDFSELSTPVADKHSTGGVGDKTSLIIAPLVACCGVSIPMISGRGLGHTGGTLDKLESISGYNVNLSTDEFKRIINQCGFAMTGQTADIAPADKKIYALRDATATVSCIPLIVASIMSKKLAEGLNALVLDVKTGSGAFMQKFEDSKKLAEALIETGNNFGVKTEAVISDMNQPLGKYVGNALEVYECIEILKGDIDAELEPTWELSLELSARILVLTGVAETLKSARETASSKLFSGAAFEKFKQNVELQGGDPKICDASENLFDKNLLEVEINAHQNGFVSEIDTLVIGNAIVQIGGGRKKTGDSIDHSVGYMNDVKIGDRITKGEPLGLLFCRDENQARQISEKLQNAYKISEEKPLELKLVKEIIS